MINNDIPNNDKNIAVFSAMKNVVWDSTCQ